MKKKKKKALYFRMNFLFFVVFLLFSTLILRLGYVQIVKGEEYKEETEKTTKTEYSWNSPRGKFLDRNGIILVENDPIYTLTYTNPSGDTAEARLKLAKKLATMISMETDKVTERDKKDYWILTRKEEAYSRLTKKEKNKLDDTQQYQLVLKRITDEDLATITDEEMKVLAIKRGMDIDSASDKRIKMGLTTDEIAVISEHLEELPGVDVKVDSERKYVYGDTLRQIFGSVGQIPEEDADQYAEAGYDLSDLVGTSFLEEQYEDLLKGKKEKQTYVLDSSGNVTGDVKVSAGKTGKDLMLTIDINLQQQVEQILEEELKKDSGADSAYAVVMNPTNGEILAIAGKKEENNEVENETYGALYNAYAMGSSVKGATLLTGYQTGVITPGTTFLDAPIQISGTPIKKSYTNMGVINDLTALERSSNVYMFHVAMKIGGYNYATKSGFKDPASSFATMRKYFAEFGLGVETEIDLPQEATGYNGGVKQLGNLMDLAIGQFDTYTPLQLVQYVSTIANDGKRMKPHLLKEVRDPDHDATELGTVIEEVQPTVLNTIDMDMKDIERVQQGFRLVYSGSKGTATSYFKGVSYSPAGKTGTAQVIDPKGGYNYNLTLVGYAPYDNPEVAFSVVVPDSESDSSPINKNIGRRILDAYFAQ